MNSVVATPVESVTTIGATRIDLFAGSAWEYAGYGVRQMARRDRRFGLAAGKPKRCRYVRIALHLEEVANFGSGLFECDCAYVYTHAGGTLETRGNDHFS